MGGEAPVLQGVAAFGHIAPPVSAGRGEGCRVTYRQACVLPWPCQIRHAAYVLPRQTGEHVRHAA